MSSQRYGSAAPFAEECAAAAARLDGIARTTPLEPNPRLSDATGADVWLKREDLQVGRSYKLRGAYNLLAQLGPAERAAGAVCASAGNHGQGVAYACRRLGMRGRVHVLAELAVELTPRGLATGVSGGLLVIENKSTQSSCCG